MLLAQIFGKSCLNCGARAKCTQTLRRATVGDFWQAMRADGIAYPDGEFYRYVRSQGTLAMLTLVDAFRLECRECRSAWLLVRLHGDFGRLASPINLTPVRL